MLRHFLRRARKIIGGASSDQGSTSAISEDHKTQSLPQNPRVYGTQPIPQNPSVQNKKPPVPGTE